MSRIYIIVFALLICFGFITSPDGFVLPEHFPPPVYNFKANPSSSEKVALGRALFYDPVLSKDGTISCASCHSPYNAFAHTDHDLSHGIGDSIGTRNAPALFNLAWQPSFMWDGAIHHLDMQALAPISHPREMGEDIKQVVQKLQQSEYYPTLFFNAYKDSIITGEYVLKALSQFQLTLVSAASKYDNVQLGKEKFTTQEANGYDLFTQYCNTCHTEPLFSNYGFARNGLPVDTTLNDFGKWMITRQPADSLLFKVPSLRNLSYTYPYMHDGRFQKLSEVLDYYTKGIQHRPALSKELASPISMTTNEKVDLIAFLLTLNDKEFVFDKKHQFPKEILSKPKD